MLDFENLQFLSCVLCRHEVLLPHTKFRRNRTIGRWVMTKITNFKMAAAAAILNSKNFILGHVTVTGFNIWCSVPNFIKIWQFFTEIWRFNDFQNGGRPPSWILHICIFLSRSPCEHAVLLSYKISLKSDNRLMSNGQKTDFQDGSRSHLEFQKLQFLVTWL